MSAPPTTLDRREHRRIPLSFPLRLGIRDIGKFTDAHARDLSEGGIFIPMGSPLPEGSEVVLEFCLESAGKTIRAHGRVVRSISAGEPGTAGMGIAFTHLGKDGRRLVELVVQRFSRHHPSQAVELPPDLLRAEVLPIQAEKARSDPRADLRVRYRRLDEEAFRDSTGHTLPPGEVFVATASPDEVGTLLELQLAPIDGESWTGATGIVKARVYSPGTAVLPPSPGVAVELRGVPDALRAILSGGSADRAAS